MHIGWCVLVYYPCSENNNNNNNNWKYASLYTGETVSRRRGRSSSYKTIMFMLPRCSLMSIWQWSFCLCALPAAVRIYFYSLFSISRSSQFAGSQNIIPIPTTHLTSCSDECSLKQKTILLVSSQNIFSIVKGKQKWSERIIKSTHRHLYNNIAGHIERYKRSVELYSF